MYVTRHARERIADRVGALNADHALDYLFAIPGEPGVVAYIVDRYPEAVSAPDGSNGDTLVVVAVDGSVETVFWRRSTQDMSAAFFGAAAVVDLTAVG